LAQSLFGTFAFQAQPILPNFRCCAVHVRKAVNGKGKPETVRKLEKIKELLIKKGLDIVDYAFDGDSCYHRLYKEFKNIWRCKSRQLPDPRRLFDMPIPPQLIRPDVFHILKKIRYQLLCECGGTGAASERDRDAPARPMRTKTNIVPMHATWHRS
jgi:hypothetical protein